MMKIYHNPRCRKSREALQVLHEHNMEPEIVLYLENPLSADKLASIIKKSEHSINDFVRKSEPDYKENLKGKVLSETQWIEALSDFPKVMQRPIVETTYKAIIARDAALLKDWLKTISV